MLGCLVPCRMCSSVPGFPIVRDGVSEWLALALSHTIEAAVHSTVCVGGTNLFFAS